MSGGHSGSLRLASYNIRKAVGTDRVRDPHRVLDVIRTLRGDIVALQEADRRLGQRPSALPRSEIEARTGLVPVDAAANPVSLGWHGNALLVRPEIGVLDIERLELPGIEPRGGLLVELDRRGAQVRVIGLHLGLLRSSRRAQITAILSHLADRPAMPTVLAGDLNEWSLTVGLGRIARDFRILVPGRTYHSRLPVAALDRLAVNSEIHVRRTEVVDTHATRRASDHLPIWMDFDLGS